MKKFGKLSRETLIELLQEVCAGQGRKKKTLRNFYYLVLMLLDADVSLSLAEMQQRLADRGTYLSADAVRRRLERAQKRFEHFFAQGRGLGLGFELAIVEDTEEERTGDERRYFLEHRPDEKAKFQLGRRKFIEAPIRIGSIESRGLLELNDGNVVAVRMFRRDAFPTTRLMEQFNKWVDVQRNLNPERFLPLLSVVEEEDWIVIHHSASDGPSLRSLLDDGKRLNEPEVLEMCGKICSGLEELNRKGLIHGEIRPENILLAGNSSAHEVALRNVSVFQNVVEFDPKLFSQVMGVYAAPEHQLAGRLSEKSDVFGLGVVMIESWLGRVPFQPGEWRSDAVIRHHLAGLDLLTEERQLVFDCLRIFESDRASLRKCKEQIAKLR